ncbi:transcription elongation factor GreA [Microgenomates bacterium UTCPR1]|nr:MAG: transcription elongation factor GreA [Microgenomates bacterium UTCPR1]
MKPTVLTKNGFQKIEKELDDLVKNKRPYAIDRLHKARSMGDLSENSEYSAAKEELAFVEGRIKEIEEILRSVEIVENSNNNESVEIGSTVIVEVNGRKDEFQIVGEFEADPMNKKLSFTAPIGKALLNKKVNDLIEVEIPAGKVAYKIIEIK